MPDDPLFDPWSTVEAGSVNEPTAAAAEPETPADEPETAPADAASGRRPTPKGPMPGQPTQAQQERSLRRWQPTAKTGEMPRTRPVPPPRLRSEGENGMSPPAGPGSGKDDRRSEAESGVSHPRPEVDHADRRPPSRGSSTLAERLQDVALPRLGALEARLRIARHRTLLDDRLDRDPPTIRFRLIPRRGPFDDVSAVPGSVLEIVAEDGLSIAAKLWLDPVAEEPTDELRVAADRLTEAWIDEIAMDFVEKTLRRR